MSTQVEKIATGVWVDAMLKTLARQRNGVITVKVIQVASEQMFEAEVTFRVNGVHIILSSINATASIALRSLGRKLEDWEARQ